MSILNSIANNEAFKFLKLPVSVEERKKLYFFILAFLTLLLVVVLSVLNFIWLNKTVEISPAKNTSSLVNIKKGRIQADSINQKITSYKRYRDESSRMVIVAETVGVSPISEMQTFIVVDKEIAVPEFPPNILIKALIVMDVEKVAILDIEGEPPGMVCRTGTIFGAGKGKITDIDSKGVSWTWVRKKHRINL